MKLEGLNTTGDCNLVSINFLDVTMSLNPHEHKPFMKANTKLEYLDTKSNHPPVILKNIATGVEQRLRNISSSKKCFNEDIKSYQDALKNAGHKHELRYETDLPDNVETVISEDSGDSGACGTVPNEYERPSQPTRTRQKKTRVRKNIIYFNPPYNAEVQTNVGRLFLNLVQKHFGKDKTLKKLFNKNNVKVSYSCGRNIGQNIKSHNKHVMSKFRSNHLNIQGQINLPKQRTCNCPRNKVCPLNGECLKNNIVYKANVLVDGLEKYFYVGQTINAFKTRLSNHLCDFRKPTRRTKTSLSKFIWRLIDENKQWSISWEKLAESETYSRETKVCRICMEEKIQILKLMTDTPGQTINHRSELVNYCGHKWKEMLSYPDGLAEGVESQETDLHHNNHDSHVDSPEGTTSSDTMDPQDADQLDRQVDGHPTEAYLRALQIYEEEQQKEGAARHTRGMKIKRIEHILADFIDPG